MTEYEYRYLRKLVDELKQTATAIYSIRDAAYQECGEKLEKALKSLKRA